MSGYTLSYRDKWTHPVFRNLLEAGIWSWMCDTAAWKKTKIRFNGNIVDLERGQLATSIRFMSKGFNIGEQATRRFLENLEKEGLINTLPTHYGTIITICNYSKYQDSEKPDNTPTNTRPTHDQHTPNTNKNTINTGNESKKDNTAVKPPDVSEQVWNDFLKIRKGKKAPLTETALKGIASQAEKSGWTLEEALTECCERGWQSFKANWVDSKKQSGETLADRLRRSTIGASNP